MLYVSYSQSCLILEKCGFSNDVKPNSGGREIPVRLNSHLLNASVASGGWSLTIFQSTKKMTRTHNHLILFFHYSGDLFNVIAFVIWPPEATNKKTAALKNVSSA